MRIISTVPSQTELLFDLGLEDEVVGITKFCVHPEKWFRNKERIGGTKTLKLDKIRSLKPDLILANKEENVKEQIEELAKEFKVFVSEVKTVKDNINLINKIGHLTNRKTQAQKLSSKLQAEINSFARKANLRVAYLIWQDPIMVAGGDTYINSVLELLGCINVFKSKMRYPTTSIEELKSLSPDVLLLSSEPYPYSQKHVEQYKKVLPNIKASLVDGEAFSWYGSRLIKKSEYLHSIFS